jgi:signal transduction histidine kinase
MRRPRIGTRDMVSAVGVAVTLLAAVLSRPDVETGSDLLGYGLVAVSALALVASRRYPIVALAATGSCGWAYQSLGLDVPVVAFLFAVYAAVRAGHRLVTVVTAAVVLVALPLTILWSSQLSTSEGLARAREALPLAWLVAAAAAGEALRQAERRADEAERTREETARRRADEERLHLARELHDSLTHQISVIKLQAEVAVHLAERRGDQVPGALLAIRDAAREATRELRSTLDALRDDDNAAYGLAELPDLLRRVRASGLDASLTVEGQREDVPAAVDRAAYRIVQESLTNIAHHAAAATASVRISYRPQALSIRVDDDGHATPGSAPTVGVGLLGMRERVAAVGGHLEAAPRAGGGFRVQAELPVQHPA